MHRALLYSLVIVACVSAHPGILVEHSPVAVSHQSQSVVHGQAHLVAPISIAETGAVVPISTAAVLPPREISFHGAPLIKGLAAAATLSIVPAIHY